MKEPKIEVSKASDFNQHAYTNACKAYDSKKYSVAINLFKEALEYWPDDYQAWWAMGNCYDEIKKPVDAEECYRQAVAFCAGKDESKIHYNLANTLFDQKRFGEAIEIYNKVSKKSDVWASTKINLILAQELN